MHRFVYTHGDKSPEERVLLTPVIAKGQFYPLTQKHGSISKKFVVRIYFVRALQQKGILGCLFCIDGDKVCDELS